MLRFSGGNFRPRDARHHAERQAGKPRADQHAGRQHEDPWGGGVGHQDEAKDIEHAGRRGRRARIRSGRPPCPRTAAWLPTPGSAPRARAQRSRVPTPCRTRSAAGTSRSRGGCPSPASGSTRRRPAPPWGCARRGLSSRFLRHLRFRNSLPLPLAGEGRGEGRGEGCRRRRMQRLELPERRRSAPRASSAPGASPPRAALQASAAARGRARLSRLRVIATSRSACVAPARDLDVAGVDQRIEIARQRGAIEQLSRCQVRDPERAVAQRACAAAKTG